MTSKISGRVSAGRSLVCALLYFAALAVQAFDTPYLTFRSATSFTLNVRNKAKNWDGTLQYSTDTTNWTTWDGTTTLNAVQSDGQYRLYLRGSNNTILTGEAYGKFWELTGSEISCDGDIETLRGYDGNVPAMGGSCYRYLFSGCTALVKAPEFSATVLATNCYQYTFQNCTSLTEVSDFPSATLASSSCGSMFSGCSALTAPPALPSTALANNCYNYMFQNCTSLTSLPALPATTTADLCYFCMFDGCTSLVVNSSGEGVEWSLPTMVSTGTIYNWNMFSNTGGDFTGNPVAGTTYYVASALPPGLSLKADADKLAAYVGESVNFNLADTIKGGTGVYAFTGTVPAGLTMNPNGTVSGSVAVADIYNFTLRVTDTTSPDPLVLDAAYTLTVATPDPITAATSLAATVGKAKNFNIAETISGGVPPYALAFSGTEPTGFSYSAGVLSGKATEANTYNFTITVTDSLGTEKVLNYTLETTESAGFTDDDPEEPASGTSAKCITADGVERDRTCNQVVGSSTAVTWEDSWYYVTGNVTLSAGVTVVGKVSLILGDDATLTISKPSGNNAGINVSSGNVLTIYCQGNGTGSLTVEGGGFYCAGIGGNDGETAGAINIYGGVIASTGGFYGAAFGGGQNGDGGTVKIYGGTVTAVGYFSPGIGGGYNGNGGTVLVNGGTVTAYGNYASYPGIGAYGSYSQGTLTVGANVVVKAGSSSTLTDSDIQNPGGETSISLATKYQYYLIEKQGPAPLTQDTSAFVAHVGEAFNQALAGTVSGGTSPYSFALKSQTLSEKGLSYADGVISGTTTATGSATVTVTVSDSATGSDHQSEDFTYTVTVTYPPKSITYIDSRDGTTPLAGLEPAQHTPGTATPLPTSVPTASSPLGYELEGWYLTAACDGTKVTFISVEAITPQTFYANWTPIEYAITYKENADTQYPGIEPSKYTVEDAVALPTDAVAKYGYEFDGWYTTSAYAGSRVTEIPKGSTGPKTFYAKWIVAPVDMTYIDADGTPQTKKCTPVDSTSTTLTEGWYVASGTVSISSTVTVSGNVKLVLADGATLSVSGSSNKAGINVATGKSLTIYAQENGTGSLNATGGSYGAGIGGNSGEACGTVTVYGGNVTARSNSMYGSGIGGGQNGNGGTVTIYGGTVVAQSQYSTARGAGIGGGGSSSTSNNGNGGAVTIYGGTVTAESNKYGSGIGGGYYGNGGTISIYGGTVTASSAYGGSGIGGGYNGSGGNVTINGGTVTATAGDYNGVSGNFAVGIGKGYGNTSSYANGTLTVGASMKAYVGSSANPTAELGSNRSYRYYVVKAAPLSKSVSAIEANAGDPCNINLAETVVGGSGTYTFEFKSGNLPSELEIDGTTLSGTVSTVGTYVFTLVVTDTTAPTPQSIDAEYTLTVKVPGYIDDDPAEPASGVEVDCRTSDGKVRRRTCNQVSSSATAVTWDNSWYYVTGDVTLSAGVTVVGKVSLVLADDATLTVTQSSANNAGINVSVGNSLVIYGQTKGNGKLNASAGPSASTSGYYGAGIGGNKGSSGTTNGRAGTIKIYGGDITARGSYYGSGIGGGYYGAGGTVEVYGGKVDATGGSYGAGIGGGYCAAGGTVKVCGGEVEATCGSASTYAIGIGRGGGSSSYTSGYLYVYATDVVVKAGTSSTASLSTLTPNTTTRQVSVSSYDYFFIGVVPLRQKTSALAAALTGQQKSWTLSSTVDGMAPFTFVVKEGSSLPEGLTLENGVISGRVSTADNYSFTLVVSDSASDPIEAEYTLAVNDPAPITVATTDFGSIEKGKSFYQTISPSGGVSPYTFSSGEGRPAGINFYTEAGVGVLSGSCSTPGDYKFTITITDSALPANVQPIEFSLSVKDVYAITYYDGEETLTLSPATYVEDTGVATLPTPTKEGSAFLGWYTNPDGYGAPVTAIPADSTGPVSLYSKWYTPETGAIPVTFTGADGEQTETCTVIESSMAVSDTTVVYNNTSSIITLSSGWYVVANIDTLPEKTSIKIDGEVNIVLKDDRSLTIAKPAYAKQGCWMSGIILTAGNTLNIYGQTKGTGTLTANGFNSAAGIGGWDHANMRACGTVRIYGGTVNAVGGSGAAGIGGSSGDSGAGTVEIYGGTVTATGTGGGAGIGTGSDSLVDRVGADGGTVKIYGGTVTATGSAFSYSGDRVGAGAGIGGGGATSRGGAGGTVEIYGGNVTAIGGVVNENVSAAGIGGGNGAESQGTLKVSGEYAVVYAGADADSATERTPDANEMVELDGSPYYEIQGEGAAPVTYNITYISAGVEQTWLEPNQYTHGFVQTLATPDPREGYTFDGWFVDDQFNGDAVTEVPANATGDKMFYAKWTPVSYTITYKNVNGEEVSVIDGLAPATYTIESGATLPTEISLVKAGWVFDGWCSYVTGPQVTTIPVGTTGDKTFYVRWDVSDFGLFDGELAPTEAGVEGEWDLNETIHKGTQPYSFILKDVPGNALPDGLALDANGTLSGSVALAGEYVFTITVTDSSEPQKTIDAEYTLDVRFHKQASGASGEDANLLIGHPMATMSLSTSLSGGTGPYTFEWIDGALPSGLKLNGTQLEGTPTEKGNFYFELEATDANGVSSPLDYWIFVGSDTLQQHFEINGIDWQWVSSAPPKKDGRIAIYNGGARAVPAGTAGCVYVPPHIGNLSEDVTCLGAGAFSNCTAITRVTLPETMIDIGKNAFYGCSSLTALVVRSNVENINEGAFDNCPNLAAIYVEEGSAERVRGLVQASGRDVGGIAFVECAFYTLTLDTNLGDELWMPVLAKTYVESNVYLLNVGNLPVPTRNHYTFDGWYTEKFGGIRINEDDTLSGGDWTLYAHWTTTLDAPVFSIDDDYNGVPILQYIALNRNTEVTLPDGVEAIGGSAKTANGGHVFTNSFDRSIIQRVTMPSSVKRIRTSAFSDCYNLSEVYLSSALTNIGLSAFSQCGSLKAIDIPGTVDMIESFAFGWCSNLVGLVIGNGVREIGDSAFYNCKSLEGNGEEGLVIPDSVKVIGRGAFQSSGIRSLTIPKGVAIGDWAFAWCENLESVNVGGEVLRSSPKRLLAKGVRLLAAAPSNPDGITIGRNAFTGNKTLGSITIGSTVEEIGGGAFSGCQNLTTVTLQNNDNFTAENGMILTKDGATLVSVYGSNASVTISDGVVAIRDGAFAGDETLESVVIPSGVATIGEAAFSNATEFATITIPQSVTEIGANAFYGTKLSTVNLATGDVSRVSGLIAASGYNTAGVTFLETLSPAQEDPKPSIAGDSAATVTGNAEDGFVVVPSTTSGTVEVDIPEGVAADKVTLEVPPTATVKPNGATVKVVTGANDITEFLDIPPAVEGVINLNAATVKEAIVKEALDPTKEGVEIVLDPENPSITTAPTKPGLTYTFSEGTTLEGMTQKDTKIGDGTSWTPEISVKKGTSGFYSIGVTK